MPQQRPNPSNPAGPNGTRPNFPGANGNVANRPQQPNLPTTRPSVPNLGGGAGNVGTLPGMANRPANTLPGMANRPANPLPGAANRPANTLPGTANRPATPLPGVANRPANPLPGTVRPGGERPVGERPNNPNLANRPGNMVRPGAGGTARPLPGDVGDFLGMDRPLRPQTPETLPGVVPPGMRPGTNLPGLGNGERPGNRPDFSNRPGINNRPGVEDRPGLENRPGISNRPGLNDRPGITDRPGLANRPGLNDRPGLDKPWKPDNRPWQPGNPGDWRPGNLPDWANRPNVGQVNNNWNNVINSPNLGNWTNLHPERTQVWNNWGNNVRNNWNVHVSHNNWFHGNWWNQHFNTGFAPNHWHYGRSFTRYPWRHWWAVPTFVGLTNWFTWSAPAASWQQPIYYDYGTGGNVVYNDNSVYIDGQQIASAGDFAASAATLAAVEPPATEADADAADWMPLGTFAVSTNEADAQPHRVVQLAVDKAGVVSGTLYNSGTDVTQTLLGQVDKQTQRVALRVGESNLVVETGLYNLTQDQAPLLVHFGADRVENWLLVRLEAAPEDATTTE